MLGLNSASWDLTKLVMAFEVARSGLVAILEGRDSNHLSYETVIPKDQNLLIVGPEYHALHHVHPDAYISCTFKLFDWFMGTANSLRGRNIALISFDRWFGEDVLKAALLKEGVARVQMLGIETLEKLEDERTEKVLGEMDILVFQPEAENVGVIIELFKKVRKMEAKKDSLMLPEVWCFYAVSKKRMRGEGKEERMDDERRALQALQQAKGYLDDEGLVYRHIITEMPSTNGQMRGGGKDVEGQVRSTVWWIKRGARYVLEECSWAALLAYLKFLYVTWKRW